MEANATKPKKIKQIKTICMRVGFASDFDDAVNKALADGWYLVKRYTLPSYHEGAHTALVAELERYAHD